MTESRIPEGFWVSGIDLGHGGGPHSAQTAAGELHWNSEFLNDDTFFLLSSKHETPTGGVLGGRWGRAKRRLEINPPQPTGIEKNNTTKHL